MKREIFSLAYFFVLVTSRSYLLPGVENCGSSGKTLTFTRCKVDASHKFLMIQTRVTKEVHNFTASGSIQTFIGSEYKQIFKYAEIDWCKFMRKKLGSAMLNPAAKIVVESIRETSGNLFHECPYFGDYEANITMAKTIVSMIPSRLYKYNIMASNEFDDDFFHISFTVEIK